MSEFDSIKDLIRESDENISASQAGNTDSIDQEIKEIKCERKLPFDISVFSQEVASKAENKNRIYSEIATNINAYDIADNCIRQIVYKLTGKPISSFGDKWLPLSFRSTLGSACHDFIQGISKQFTESEISLKIPSIRFSGRIDNLIGNNVLVEIKSCTYNDYKKIIRDQKPRLQDFYQVMTYKYVLENFLNEAKNPDNKTRTSKPVLDEYEIDTLQFIYLAHDITASDIDDFSTALKVVDTVKKQLNSKRNPFYFMTSLVLDTNCFDEIPYMNFIKDKLSQINFFLNNNKLPSGDNEYVNRKKCFFCLYNNVCDIK